jgi:hypothetical protein
MPDLLIPKRDQNTLANRLHIPSPSGTLVLPSTEAAARKNNFETTLARRTSVW